MSTPIQQVPLVDHDDLLVEANLFAGYPKKFLEIDFQNWKNLTPQYQATEKRPAQHKNWPWDTYACYATINGKSDCFYWIEYNNEIQGIMLAFKTSDIFSIKFLSTAPWNYFCDKSRGCYRGVGKVLVAAAVAESFDVGCCGRVLLNSLPQSTEFYSHLGFAQTGNVDKEGLPEFLLTEAAANNIWNPLH